MAILHYLAPWKKSTQVRPQEGFNLCFKGYFVHFCYAQKLLCMFSGLLYSIVLNSHFAEFYQLRISHPLILQCFNAQINKLIKYPKPNQKPNLKKKVFFCECLNLLRLRCAPCSTFIIIILQTGTCVITVGQIKSKITLVGFSVIFLLPHAHHHL